MGRAGELQREITALRERLSRLNEASLRINESLDLNVVLRELVESARALTGAGYGGITTLDDDGRLLEFVSSGFTEDEYHQVLSLPDGQRVFEYLSAVPEPLRTPDLLEHVRSRGFSGGVVLMKTFLGAPIRHRDRQVAHFYLGDKDGGLEFTGDDEEALTMLASQAAAAIANLQRRRHEQRARADLETLIDSSPVGVVVFDARSGQVASQNREAARIAHRLSTVDRAPEQVLDVLAVRRADGSEIDLGEMSLVQALGVGETVRAEEMVLQVPGGRPVTILVNATPIRSKGGYLESVVVTLQDLTPLEELERLRAEFLAMVSHELTAPLTSIKGSATTLLGAADSLDAAELLQFHRIIDQQADHMQQLLKDLQDVARIETGTLSVAPEAVDAAVLVDQARKASLIGGGRNNIHIDLAPDLPPVAADRPRVVQVLGRLLSNAARHSPETSPISLSATLEGAHVAFSVADEGMGMPAELLPHLFRKHSRLGGDDRSGIAASGLGLAICKGIVEAHGGRIRAESDGPGTGARFTFTVPALAESAHPASRGSPTFARSRRMGPGGRRVLALDNDPEMLRYVRETLMAAGYVPIVTADPEGLGRLIVEEKPDLVLLDLTLPGPDGMDLMERLPELTHIPVIFLSGYGGDQILARALGAGADDYIVKPFSPTELVARIETVLRRRTAPEGSRPSKRYSLGNLNIDYTHRQVTVADRPVRLTDKEYRLLVELAVNAGRALTHDYLLRQVWGPGYSRQAGLVRTVVKNLRRKLGDEAGSPTYIFTEQRVGYRMAGAGPRPEEA